MGNLYPPVFRAASIKDFKEFRKFNKMSAASREMIPRKSGNPDNLFAAKVSAVVIIPNAQHFPAFDPQEETKFLGLIKEESLSVKLQDSEDSIIAHPCEHTFTFWPYLSRFDDVVGQSTFFSEEKWRYWRERSWKHTVVLLAQYQRARLFDATPETISDNYWLLDIISSEGGIKKRVKERKPQGEQQPVFNPQQI